MHIPYYSFAIIYVVVLVFYAIFLFFNFYHMVRFGFFDFVGKLQTAMLAAVVVIILFFTGLFLRDVDWLDSFSLFDGSSFNDLKEKL